MLQKYILNGILKLELFLFKQLVVSNQPKKMVFLDIDNTLADTWPTLLPGKKFTSEKVRLSSLPVLNGSKDYVENHLKVGYSRIFLSHRPFWTFGITKNWLKIKGIWKNGDRLFLVKNPTDKLLFFKAATSYGCFCEIVVMDDLSFGHESGNKPQFYTAIISEVQHPPFRYLGYSFILLLNQQSG